MAWKEQTGEHTWRVRYRHNGEIFTVPEKFATEQDAGNYIADMESDQRRGRWVDPADGRMPLGEWAALWMRALDVEPPTEENYQGLLRNSILPRWSETAIGDITALDVATWRKELRHHYAASTINGILRFLSMILADAVDQRMIEVNPVHRKRHRGRRRDHAPSRLEKVWALPEEVIRIAVQAGMLGGAVARLLVIMTAWTGCRWGEMVGLQRDRVDLRRGVITIDPDVGCLHESAHGLWLGPPKTPSSARTIQLPPFLVDLLGKHLAQHASQFVFTAPQGGWLRRSDFNRRVFRPAVEGDLKRGLYPVKPGLTFHGLRHSHKTWLAADHIPEIASTKRMGHHLSDKLAEVYTHVAPKMEREILKALQRLWKHAQHAAVRPADNRPGTRHEARAPRSRARSARAQAAPVAVGSPSTRSAHSDPTPARRPRRANARSAIPQASSRAVSVSASRAHHRAGALRSASGVTREPEPVQVRDAAPGRRGADEGMIVLQKRSSNQPGRDHGHERVSIIRRMKKALRPARLLRSKSFDREWS
jgi:integrase